MAAGSRALLQHPNGCVIEFQPVSVDGLELVRVTSSRPGRDTWTQTVGRSLSMAWWNGWIKREGFSPLETKGN